MTRATGRLGPLLASEFDCYEVSSRARWPRWGTHRRRHRNRCIRLRRSPPCRQPWKSLRPGRSLRSFRNPCISRHRLSQPSSFSVNFLGKRNATCSPFVPQTRGEKDETTVRLGKYTGSCAQKQRRSRPFSGSGRSRSPSRLPRRRASGARLAQVLLRAENAPCRRHSVVPSGKRRMTP